MITVASRRASAETLRRRFGEDALILDVTSRGPEPWVRFSPFYPHGAIPVPRSPGWQSASVEGLWQGLKVFERADIDTSKFEVTSMRGIKRSARQFGRVLGHRAGVSDQWLLPYAEARHAIYLPAYRWVLDHDLQDLLDRLRKLAAEHTVVLLDYETNGDVADLSRPLSHACLILRYLEGTWPEDDPRGPDAAGQIPSTAPSPTPGDDEPGRVRTALDALQGDREHGASWLSREAARLLAGLTEDVPEPTARERAALVRETARELARARPSMAALCNTAARIWYAGDAQPSRASLPMERLARMHTEAERLIAAWESAAERIVSFARPLLGETVFTLSRSGTVETVLTRLAQNDGGSGERRLRQVIVAESRPGGEGIAAARALAAAGLEVMLVPDAAMAAFIGEAAAVVLGADSIRADGGVVNKVGSYPLALLAREAGVPVYVLAESLKIAAPDFPLVLETLEWPEMPEPPAPGVQVRTVGFELVPADLVTAVVTEAGVLGRAQVEERARTAGEALARLF